MVASFTTRIQYPVHSLYHTTTAKVTRWRPLIVKFIHLQKRHYLREDEFVEDLKTDNDKKKRNMENRLVYAVPFHTQVTVLLNRTWRTIWREKVLRSILHTLKY